MDAFPIGVGDWREILSTVGVSHSTVIDHQTHWTNLRQQYREFLARNLIDTIKNKQPMHSPNCDYVWLLKPVYEDCNCGATWGFKEMIEEMALELAEEVLG